MKIRNHHVRTSAAILALGLGAVSFCLISTVSAATISGATQKLTVYQGVVVIAPGGGKILELGNEGQDIASTDTIYLRPDSMSEANGARIVKNGATANLYVNELCFSGSGSEICKTVIPTPAGGDSTWTQNVGGFTTLSPTDADTGVLVGTYTSPIANRTALSLSSTWAGPALVVNGTLATGWYSPGADPAGFPSTISYEGYKNVQINGGNLAVNTSSIDGDGLRVWAEEIQGNDYTVPWHAGNDGIFNHSAFWSPGPDAETIDSDTAMPFLPPGTTAKLEWYYAVATTSWGPPLTQLTVDWDALCVKTPYDQICVHGTQAGRGCGAVAPVGGITAAACTAASGTCTQMCYTEQKTCTATDRSGQGYCWLGQPGLWCKGGVNDRQACNTMGYNVGNCPGGYCSNYNKPCLRSDSWCEVLGNTYCYYGAPYIGSWLSPIPGDWGSCQDFCRGYASGWVRYCLDAVNENYCSTPCDGEPAGACSNFGTEVLFDSGIGIGDWGNPGCDCYLSKDEPYLSGKMATPATGALLCTKPLTE